MARIVTTLSIEPELYKKAKEQGICFSELLNDALKKKLQINEYDEIIKKYCSLLKLSDKVSFEARKLIEENAHKLEKRKILPSSITASAVYMASHLCKESRTQEEVWRATNTSPVTIRKLIKLFVS